MGLGQNYFGRQVVNPVRPVLREMAVYVSELGFDSWAGVQQIFKS